MSSQLLFFNGQFLKEEKAIITASNRSLRYGDGLFETMRLHKGLLQLPDYHFDRLFKGLDLLQFNSPGYFTPGYLQQQILELCRKNNLQNARVRVTIARGEGGLFDPVNHFPNCIIQTMPLQPRLWNENGLVVGIYKEAQKNADKLANLKHNNYLVYAMAALQAKQQQWNDAIILNNHHRICDSAIATVFIVKNQQVYTPALSEGVVAGTIRRWLMENETLIGVKIQERPLTIEDLLAADEVFLTNAIYGVRWVEKLENAVYGFDRSRAVFEVLNRTI